MSEAFTGFYPFLFERRGIMYDAAHLFVHPHDGYRLSDRIWRTSQKTRNKIDLLLAHEIRNGTAAVDIAKQLEGFLKPERAGVQTRKPYGRWGSYDARRLARTEITAAHGRATLGAAEANPFVQAIRWALSAFRDDWDCKCEPNAEADSGLGPGVYELGSVPDYPDHPHCMCNLQPQVVARPSEVVADLRGWLDGEPGGPGSLEMFGLEGNPTSGLRSRPADALAPAPERSPADLDAIERAIVQQDYETAVIVGPDGQLVLQKKGTHNAVRFSDEELAMMRGATLSHNHPGGNSLSKEDVQLALDFDAKEMRAVTRNARYSIQPRAQTVSDNIIASRIREIEEELMKETWAKIRTGAMTVPEANKRHFHELWARCQWKLKDANQIDLVYRRVQWSP